MKFKKEFLQSLPKVSLHDHLDGGMRPETILDLAKEYGFTGLPTEDPVELAKWFREKPASPSLEKYLEGFAYTVGVLQTEKALERAAYEYVEDMKKDGVIYFETRLAPIQHLQKGLDLKTVVKAVLTGLQRGKKDFGIEYGFIWDTLRFHDATVSMSDITAALELRDQGVVGYDLAGPEKGFPVKIHKEALELAIKNNFNITLHAGEAYGKDSIAQALRYGAHRLGHACTLIEDVKHEGTKIVSMGKLAQYVLDKRVTLEMCPTSNLDTGALTDLKDHPFPVFFHNDFRVTLNTDNRLMSGVTLTDEYDRAARLFELNLEHLETLSINAMKSAFANYDLRKKMINDVIRPAFAKAKLQLQNDPTSVLEAL